MKSRFLLFLIQILTVLFSSYSHINIPLNNSVSSIKSIHPRVTTIQTAKVIGNGDAVPVSAVVDESGNLDFPCIRIPNLTPGSPTAPSIDTVDPCVSPAPPINYGAPNPIQTRFQPRAASNPQLVTSQALKGTTSEVPNYRQYNIDPSKTKLTIGDIDFTDKANIRPNPNNPENLLVTLVLPEPLKARPNFQFKLSVETREGKKAENSSVADVAAKFAVAPIHVIKIPSYDSVLEDAIIKTPVSVFEHGAVNILYQEGDKLENFVVNVPVFALDEKGMPVSVDVSNISLSGLSSGMTSASVSMTAGLAVVPLTITSSNPDTLKLEVATVSVDGGSKSAARLGCPTT